MHSRIWLKSLGRSGSHIILSHCAYNGHRTVYTYKTDDIQHTDVDAPVTVFDHGLQTPNNPEAWQLVISTRKNKLAVVMSSEICKHQTIEGNYGTKPLDLVQITIDPEFACKKIAKLNAWEKYIKEHVAVKLPWYSVVEIEHSTIRTCPERVYEYLGGQPTGSKNQIFHPGPSHKQCVENYKQLHSIVKRERTFIEAETQRKLTQYLKECPL